jgi:hypothetical protein
MAFKRLNRRGAEVDRDGILIWPYVVAVITARYGVKQAPL